MNAQSAFWTRRHFCRGLKKGRLLLQIKECYAHHIWCYGRKFCDKPKNVPGAFSNKMHVRLKNIKRLHRCLCEMGFFSIYILNIIGFRTCQADKMPQFAEDMMCKFEDHSNCSRLKDSCFRKCIPNDGLASVSQDEWLLSYHVHKLHTLKPLDYQPRIDFARSFP